MDPLANIKKVSVGRNAFKDKKHTQLLYMTYFLRFPDGDEWVKQQAFSAHDLAFELNKIMAEHFKTSSQRSWYHRCQELWDKGETWWTDEAGVESHIKIEKTKRNENWGIKKGLIEVHQITEEQFNSDKPIQNDFKTKGVN